MILSLGFLLSCVPPEGTDTVDLGDSNPATTPGDAETEQVPGADDPEPESEDYAWVFDDTVVHQIHITLTQAAQDGLRTDPYEWVEGTITVDGSEELVVGVRLRGKIGSFQELDEKPKWKIDFNRFVPGQRFSGLETLAFNNSVVDCSFTHELMAYLIFRASGQPASRMAFSEVTLNEDDYGLYQMLEFPDDVFLRDRFGKETGNLYDGKYIYGGGWDYTFIDFTPSQHDNFQLEEGEDVGLADVYGVTDVLRDYRGQADFYEGTGDVLDWAAIHPFLAAEHWTGQWDGYTLDTNNYRVYFDPERSGRVQFLTTDLDYAFNDLYSQWFSWDDPTGTVVKACYQDATCLAAQAQAVSDLLDQLAEFDLIQQLEDWNALAGTLMREDPRGGCSIREVQTEQEAMLDWVAGREAEMREFWGL
jgi:hypothetical protein